MNPTLRGFLIIGVIVLLIIVLQLEQTVISLHLIARIVFFIAIAVVLYMLWRDRVRLEAKTWPSRAQWTFYGGGAVILAAVGAFTLGFLSRGLDAIAFLAVLVFCGWSMFKTWRDQRNLSY